MIVVLLSYKVPVERVDEVRPAHLAWLREGVADGRVLLAGRQVPLTGGMFILRGTIEAARAWAATDPFATEGVADYQFIEVAPSVLAPGLEALGQ
jgi:uncharacterized protein YciI